MILQVQCPKCGKKMLYQTDNPVGKTKRCVYCGHSFKVHIPGKTRIVNNLK